MLRSLILSVFSFFSSSGGGGKSLAKPRSVSIEVVIKKKINNRKAISAVELEFISELFLFSFCHFNNLFNRVSSIDYDNFFLYTTRNDCNDCYKQQDVNRIKEHISYFQPERNIVSTTIARNLHWCTITHCPSYQ